MRRHLQLESRIRDRSFIHLSGLDPLRLQSVEVQVGRARRPAHRLPPRLPHQPREVPCLVYTRREFRYGGKQGKMGNFLIGIAMLHGGLLVAGHRDHRNAAEIGVLQT